MLDGLFLLLQRLQELVRCWKNFEENQKVVTDWMTTAEKLLNEPNLETKQSAQANKVATYSPLLISDATYFS